MSDDPRAGTTIEWPPYLQTFLTPNAMRVVNRSRLKDETVLPEYWAHNISNPTSEKSVMDSLKKEQQRARLLLDMIDHAISRAEDCSRFLDNTTK